jgi:hypothetical protein
MIELSSSFLQAAAAMIMTAAMIIDFSLQRLISLPSVFVDINCKYGDFNPKNRYLCTNTLPKGFLQIKNLCLYEDISRQLHQFWFLLLLLSWHCHVQRGMSMW